MKNLKLFVSGLTFGLALVFGLAALTMKAPVAQAGSSPAYCHNEGTNAKGPNRCSSNNDCDGARTCSGAGWCQGTSRPSNSPSCLSLRNGQGTCLDVHGPDAKKNGGRVQVWGCNGAINQKWHLKGKAMVNGQGLCLDVHGPDAKKNGGRVQVWRCNGAINQQWTRKGGVLMNGQGLCLDAHGPDAKKNGGRVQVWACSNAINQRWVRK